MMLWSNIFNFHLSLTNCTPHLRFSIFLFLTTLLYIKKILTNGTGTHALKHMQVQNTHTHAHAHGDYTSVTISLGRITLTAFYYGLVNEIHPPIRKLILTFLVSSLTTTIKLLSALQTHNCWFYSVCKMEDVNKPSAPVSKTTVNHWL